MLSHRWERPAPPNAHPDSEDGKKAAALARYGEKGSCPMTGRHEWDYFYWIDFSCVHQTSVVPKALGIAKLPLYVSLCVEVLVSSGRGREYNQPGGQGSPRGAPRERLRRGTAQPLHQAPRPCSNSGAGARGGRQLACARTRGR